MTIARLMLSAPALLGACAATPMATAPGDVPGATGSEEIRYATGPCYGTCPAQAVTLRADGTGRFEGQQHTAVSGSRDFRVDAETRRRFAALLAPHRPASGDRRIAMGTPDCGNPPSDMPSTDVRWSAQGRPAQTLHFYTGCAPDNRTLADALRTAPTLLPIAAFIGRPAG